MVEWGLWNVAKGGWRIHDYLKYNPSRAEQEARRTHRQQEGKKAADRRWHPGRPAPKATSNGMTELPADWQPSDENKALCETIGLTFAVEVNHFKGVAKEKHWKVDNWNLKFHNFLLQEVKWRERRK